MKSLLSLFLFFSMVFILMACDELVDQLPIERYQVTFETNSDISLHPLEFEVGDEITLPVLTHSQQGDFLGWYFDADFSLKVEDLSDVSEDITVYARWQEITYNIIVDVYNSVNISEVYMNDVASFYLDDNQRIYIHLNHSNPLVRELGLQSNDVFDVDGDGDYAMYTWFTKAYVLTSHGQIYAWGDNNFNERNDNQEAFIDITDQFDLAEDEMIVKMAGNETSSFALSSHGKVYGWGSNDFNLILEDDQESYASPVRLNDHWCGNTGHFLHDSGLCGDTGHLIIDMVVTERNVIFFTNSQELFLLGDDVSHWFGDKEVQKGNISEVVFSQLRGQITDIKASLNTVLFVSDLNQMLILGDSQLAQDHQRLSIGDYLDLDDDNDSVPDLFGVYLAGDTLLVHLSNHTVWGLGNNQTELISGRNHYIRRPVELMLPFTPSKLMLSSQSACAVDDDHKLWCWGKGNDQRASSSNGTILLSEDRYINYRGEDTNWQGALEPLSDTEASFAFTYNPVEVLNSPPVASPKSFYTVTRYQVSSVPPAIGYQGRILSSVVNNVCSLDNHDCDDLDPTVYPGAYQVYQESEGLVRFMLEIGIARGRAGTPTATYSGE